MATAFSCVLTYWLVGKAKTEATTAKVTFSKEDVAEDSLFFEVQPVKGKPFNIGFVPKAGTKLSGVHNILAAYPAKGAFVTFGVPSTAKTVHVTLLHDAQSIVACCHSKEASAHELLADYEAGAFTLAKYVSIPLPSK